MTDFEECVIDYWCASFAIRRARPMTAVERSAADNSLLYLSTTAPAGGMRDRARGACLGLGIERPKLAVIEGGAA